MEVTVTPVSVRRGPTRRHDTRVRRFSRDYALLERLDGLAVGDAEATRLIEEVCWASGVEVPKLKFHARRSMYTGATEQPRATWIALHGEDDVWRHERATGKRFPLFGAIRLGRLATLMTVAHELGHHLVFALEPARTPAHGKVWIGRFDDAAAMIGAAIDA
jgi:hypothetical protein